MCLGLCPTRGLENAQGLQPPVSGLLVRTLRLSRLLSQGPSVTLRCLQETLASISQGTAQHQGVEAKLSCGQCCLDAHGLERAGGRSMSEDPQPQACLASPDGPSLGLWSHPRILVHSAPRDSVSKSSHPTTSFLPLQIPVLLLWKILQSPDFTQTSFLFFIPL